MSGATVGESSSRNPRATRRTARHKGRWLAMVTALIVGLLLRFLAPGAAHLPLSFIGGLLLRFAGAGTLLLVACQLVATAGGLHLGRLLALCMLLQLSGGLTGLLVGGLLGSDGETSSRDATDEPLDWFRNLVPDNLLQAFVFAMRSPPNQTALDRRLKGARVSRPEGNPLGVAAASLLLGRAMSQQRSQALQRVMAAAGQSLTRLLNGLLTWACPMAALSLALCCLQSGAAVWSNAVAGVLALAAHAVLLGALVWVAVSRRELRQLLSALRWPLAVAAVAGSSWLALPAALTALLEARIHGPAYPSATAALVLVRCGSALSKMLALAPTLLAQEGGLAHGALLALANSLFSMGNGSPPTTSSVLLRRLAAMHDIFGSCCCFLLLEKAVQAAERPPSIVR